MKINTKKRAIIFILGICIALSNSISYGAGMTNTTQINQRGLVFNTGVSSDQIRMLKDFFRERGESNVPWGYDYDNRTKELVRNYQKSNGLGADGIAGKSTIDRINKDIIDSNAKIGLRIVSTDVKGDMIIINKSSNTLYFLKDGEIQESYPVATGKTVDLTPNGKFKIVVKFKNPRWGGAGVSDPVPGGAPNNPLGTRWIGISYGGGGKYGVHGNSNPRSIGTYASLGCVRMFNEDVEKLYERVKMNTPIWIGYEAGLESYGVKFKSNYKEKEIVKEEPIPQPKVNIQLNGAKVELQDAVINKDGTTYYPFREILGLVNAQVVWDAENNIVLGFLDDNYVEFKINSNEYKNNDEYKYLPKGQKVFIDKDKTYLPIRNLMEGLGYEVSWDQNTSTVIINYIPLENDEIIEDGIIENGIIEEELWLEENNNIPQEVETPQDGDI